MTDTDALDTLARDDASVRSEIAQAWAMMGKRDCNYSALINGLGVLLIRCSEGMVCSLQATLREATTRQRCEMFWPKEMP